MTDRMFKEAREMDDEFLTRLDRLDKMTQELVDRMDRIEKDKRLKILQHMC